MDSLMHQRRPMEQLYILDQLTVATKLKFNCFVLNKKLYIYIYFILKKTLARLELCAAVLLSKLIRKLLSIVKVKFDNIYYWTDSSIALAWIQLPSAHIKTFVANSVAAIQEITFIDDCRHIDGKLNPVDIVSRGIYLSDLLKSDIWFNSPLFLKDSKENWPKSKVEYTSRL